MAYDLHSVAADFAKAGIVIRSDASHVLVGIQTPDGGLLPIAKYHLRNGIVRYEAGQNEWGATWMMERRVFASSDDLREHVTKVVSQFRQAPHRNARMQG